MPRFRDEWVIDRVLFDYMAGGSCACCGFSHMFLPQGTEDLIKAMSDIDTDAASKEIQALAHHPWPEELRNQIWADRVRLRQKAKLRMKVYREFCRDHLDGFSTWLKQQTNLQRLLQLPRSEVMAIIRDSNQYDIHSAYAVVLCTVMEQVAFFQMTEYPPDARGSTVELAFEQDLLQFDKRGGFVLRLHANDGSLDERRVQVWLERLQSLGGPKLLDRGPSKDCEETGDADEVHAASSAGTNDNPTSMGPSFQSDRRMIRLIIARYWADLLMDKYLKATQVNGEA